MNTTRRQFLRTAASTIPILFLPELIYASPEKNCKTNNLESDSDEILLARMIFGEARGQKELEQIAIGFTPINRANSGLLYLGKTAREAILKPEQYSCINPEDKNRKKLLAPMTYEPETFLHCLDIAKKIISRELTDPANATHYFNPSIAKTPCWAKKIHRIGHLIVAHENDGTPIYSAHDFYREEKR